MNLIYKILTSHFSLEQTLVKKAPECERDPRDPNESVGREYHPFDGYINENSILVKALH